MSLPDPVVPSAAYDEDYYRHAAMGGAEWDASDGAGVHGTYPYTLLRAQFAAGQTLVDLGCGRGELVALAARAGAARAVGIEYSAAAVELARQTFAAHGVDGEVHLADARAVPVDDGVADLVTMLDVVEHLTPEELHGALVQARRLLKPTGQLLVHTLPNRLVYDVTYRAMRLISADRRRRWPADPRGDYERLMHVNEQTTRSLRAALRRAGFGHPSVGYGHVVHEGCVPDPGAKKLMHRLAAHRPTYALGRADIWASARV